MQWMVGLGWLHRAGSGDAASGGRSGGGSFKRSEPAPSRDYNRSEPAPSRDYSREPSYYRDNYSNYRQTDSYSGTGSDSEMPFGVSLALGLFCIVFLLGGLAVNNTFAKTQEGGNLPLAPDLRNDRALCHSPIDSRGDTAVIRNGGLEYKRRTPSFFTLSFTHPTQKCWCLVLCLGWF